MSSQAMRQRRRTVGPIIQIRGQKLFGINKIFSFIYIRATWKAQCIPASIIDISMSM